MQNQLIANFRRVVGVIPNITSQNIWFNIHQSRWRGVNTAITIHRLFIHIGSAFVGQIDIRVVYLTAKKLCSNHVLSVGEANLH